MRVHQLARLWVGAALVALLPATALAQGFGLNELGSCAIGRGYAATGSPCKDASTLYWNPAYAAALSGNSLVVGGASIAVTGAFTRDSMMGHWPAAVPTAYIPHLFFTHRQNEQWSWGIGAYVPYGLTSQWNPDFPGRFVAIKASIASIYVQPNVAYKINDNWMIGGGPIIAHSNVELIQSLDLSQQVAAVEPGLGSVTFGQLGFAKGTEFARGTLKGDAYSYGFTVGVFGKIADHWTMGARYLSSLNFNYSNGKATFKQINTGLVLANGNTLGPNGTSLPPGTPLDVVLQGQFAAGGPLTAQGGSTELVHPDQAEVGVGYDGFDRWLLSADYAWIGWKRFHELDITFANPALGTVRNVEQYNNSSAIRLGAQYTTTANWQLRVGFAGIATPVPDQSVTPILPDQDRTNYTAGVGIPLGKTFTLDAAYNYVDTPGRRGRISNPSSPSQSGLPLNNGYFSLSAQIISLSLKASF